MARRAAATPLMILLAVAGVVLFVVLFGAGGLGCGISLEWSFMKSPAPISSQESQGNVVLEVAGSVQLEFIYKKVFRPEVSQTILDEDEPSKFLQFWLTIISAWVKLA